MKPVLTSFLLSACLLLFQSTEAADTITIRKDPRLDILSQKQREANQRNAMLMPDGLLRGYRIQVISTPRREEAFSIHAELLKKFPDEKSYVTYQSPNFRVRIGNFIRMEDAEPLKAILNKQYPHGVYIVADGVEYLPREEEDTLTQ
ncbi:MAG: SPOR domain-containing protein [Bacteroidota bacterium]|nr:SPOR domain-containing protein [Bacteroidota bacterium]